MTFIVYAKCVYVHIMNNKRINILASNANHKSKLRPQGIPVVINLAMVFKTHKDAAYNCMDCISTRFQIHVTTERLARFYITSFSKQFSILMHVSYCEGDRITQQCQRQYETVPMLLVRQLLHICKKMNNIK